MNTEAQMDSSTLTHEEYFRLHGTLSSRRIEELLDAEADQPDTSAACTHIEEAMSGLVAEDWAAELQDKLRELHKSMRKGAAKDGVEEILGYLDDFAMQQFYNADHSRDEMRQALKSLGHYREPAKKPS